MYARSTTMRANPENNDDGIAHIRDEVMPFVQGIECFVGLSMLCDRDSGRCILTTAWETEEAMHASAERVKDSRARAGEVLGDSGRDVGPWEIALLHRRRDSPEGACTRVTWLRATRRGWTRPSGSTATGSSLPWSSGTASAASARSSTGARASGRWR